MLHKFIATEPTPRIENLLYLAAGVELMRSGLSSTRTGADGDYVLLTDYSVSGAEVSVTYTLVRPDAAGSALASIEVSLPLDQDLDAKIGSTIAELLQRANIRIVPSEHAEIKGLLPGAAGAPSESAEAPPESAGAPTESAGAPAVSAGAPTAAVVSEAPVPHKAEAEKAPPQAQPAKIAPAAEQTERKGSEIRFASSVSAAGVLFFGEMTKYFHYGLAALADVGLAWPGQSLTFGVAAELSLIRALNDDGVVGGPLYFPSAGLRLQLGTGTRSPFRVAAEVSGGATLIAVASGQQTLVQTAPYGSLGASAAFPLGEHFSLGGDVRFLMIFDNGLFIMGAMPSITLRVGP